MNIQHSTKIGRDATLFQMAISVPAEIQGKSPQSDLDQSLTIVIGAKTYPVIE
jgi:hypothetical protein